MVDLETLGNGPTSVIVQIGCVSFDRDTGEITDEFLVNVDPQSEIDAGFQVDGGTIQWWMGQAMIGKCTWMGNSHSSKATLQALNLFINNRKTKKSIVWSHSTFDAPILSYHYNRYGMDIPIRYGFWLDLRTLSMLGRGVASIPKEAKPPDAHDALADCRYQVRWAVKCWRALVDKQKKGV
jgi:hypothetical protein